MITQGFPPGMLAQGSGGGAAYNPGMMTFNGSTGYYSGSFTSSGNKVTGVIRFNRSAFTGAATEFLMDCTGSTGKRRLGVTAFSSDHATTANRSRIQVISVNSSNTVICRLISSTQVIDGSDHALFYSFDGDTGTSVFYIDGVDEDDTGNGNRVAPTTGTLESGSGTNITVGTNTAASLFFSNKLGHCGYGDQYLTNPTSFYHPTNGLQQLDEATWTEWGSQPLYWNQYATMSANAGSASNMTANGTITGPA